MNTILREAIRPWKLAVLAAGLAALFVGGRLMPAPDWSDGVSIAMGIPTYLSGGWVLERDPQAAVAAAPAGRPGGLGLH